MAPLSASEIIDFITLPAIFILVFITYLFSATPEEFFIFFCRKSAKHIYFSEEPNTLKHSFFSLPSVMRISSQ